MSSDVVVYEGVPLAEEHKEVAVAPEKPKSVFVVRWHEHEYEEGWGVDDKDSHMVVHPTMEAAVQSVEDRYAKKGTRSLYGAGDYFTYPSGPDHTFYVHELFPPAGYPLFALLELEPSVYVGAEMRDGAWGIIRRDLINAIQHPDHKPTVVPFPGLYPKPMPEEGTIMFFSAEPFAGMKELPPELPRLTR